MAIQKEFGLGKGERWGVEKIQDRVLSFATSSPRFGALLRLLLLLVPVKVASHLVILD
jgi:hypothetical protein